MHNGNGFRVPYTVGILTAAAALLVSGCVPMRGQIVHPPKLKSGERTVLYSHNASAFDVANGLTLLIIPDRQTNLVKVDMRYSVGAAEDPAGKSGLAHLAEHMAFVNRIGNGQGPTLSALLDEHALFYNAYTTWDETHYTSIGFTDSLVKLLSVEAQRMNTRCEHIDPTLLERERAVVRNERRGRDGLGATVAQLLRDQVYGKGHAYQRPIGGTDVELAAITLADVCAFFANHYAPDRAILTISGAINEPNVLNLVENIFGPIRTRSQGRQRRVTAVNLRGSSSQHQLPIEQATAHISFLAAPFGDSDRVHETFVVDIFKSRLFELQSEHDFITDTGIYSNIGGTRIPLTVVSLSVDDPSQLKQAVNLFFKDVAAFADDNLPPAAVVAMRERQRANILFSVEPFMRKAAIFTDYLQYTARLDFVQADLLRLNLVRSDTIKQWAQALFRRQDSHIMYLRPSPDSLPEKERASLEFRPSHDASLSYTRTSDPQTAEVDLPMPKAHKQPAVATFKLQNGLTVQLAPGLDQPVVDIRLMFNAGSLHEPVNQPGLARLAMMMLVSDGVRAKNLRQFLDVLTILQMGAEIDRYMDERTTTFRITGLAGYLDGLLWSLHWLLERGVYEDESLDRLRELAKREKADDDDDERRIRQAIGTALFGANHPYSRLGGQEKRTLQQVSAGDLQRFRDQNYRMDGAILIVSGQFNRMEAEKEIRRLFAWGEGAPTPPPRTVPAIGRRTAQTHIGFPDHDSIETDILIAFNTEPGLGQQYAARQVLGEMLEDRLGTLRYDLGAAYSVSVDQITRAGPGLLMLSTSVDRQKSADSMAAIARVLEEIRTGDIRADFARARRKVLHRLMAEALHSRSVADEMEFIATWGLPGNHSQRMAEDVATMRPERVKALIASELAPAQQVTLIHGRPDSVDAAFRAAGVTTWQTVEVK